MRDLCEARRSRRCACARSKANRSATCERLLANTPPQTRDRAKPWLLAPIDLQAIKAAGVTFAISMLERVIEERARGDLTAAAAIRAEVTRLVGDDLAKLKPGSPEAAHLKQVLIEQNAWSQYLEVGIGPDAEIFTKAQPMSAVGTLMDAGVQSDLHLEQSGAGGRAGRRLHRPHRRRHARQRRQSARRRGTLGAAAEQGEGQQRLLRHRPVRAACSMPSFTLDDIRATTVTLRVEGLDQYVLEGSSSIAKISRDPADLVAQMVNAHHRYPDGAVLFLGTMFAPIEDRDVKGQGFTHKTGDIVTIAAPRLGALVNRIMPTDQCEPWTFGTAALMRNLSSRGLL